MYLDNMSNQPNVGSSSSCTLGQPNQLVILIIELRRIQNKKILLSCTPLELGALSFPGEFLPLATNGQGLILWLCHTFVCLDYSATTRHRETNESLFCSLFLKSDRSILSTLLLVHSLLLFTKAPSDYH